MFAGVSSFVREASAFVLALIPSPVWFGDTAAASTAADPVELADLGLFQGVGELTDTSHPYDSGR